MFASSFFQHADEKKLWFEFQKLIYVYDEGEKKEFREVDYPIDHSFKFYQESKGFLEEEEVTIALRKYGPNRLVQLQFVTILFPCFSFPIPDLKKPIGLFLFFLLQSMYLCDPALHQMSLPLLLNEFIVIMLFLAKNFSTVHIFILF